MPLRGTDALECSCENFLAPKDKYQLIILINNIRFLFQAMYAALSDSFDVVREAIKKVNSDKIAKLTTSLLCKAEKNEGAKFQRDRSTLMHAIFKEMKLVSRKSSTLHPNILTFILPTCPEQNV